MLSCLPPFFTEDVGFGIRDKKKFSDPDPGSNIQDSQHCYRYMLIIFCVSTLKKVLHRTTQWDVHERQMQLLLRKGCGDLIMASSLLFSNSQFTLIITMRKTLTAIYLAMADFTWQHTKNHFRLFFWNMS
jgi:hypothetical protein